MISVAGPRAAPEAGEREAVPTVSGPALGDDARDVPARHSGVECLTHAPSPSPRSCHPFRGLEREPLPPRAGPGRDRALSPRGRALTGTSDHPLPSPRRGETRMSENGGTRRSRLHSLSFFYACGASGTRPPGTGAHADDGRIRPREPTPRTRSLSGPDHRSHQPRRRPARPPRRDPAPLLQPRDEVIGNSWARKESRRGRPDLECGSRRSRPGRLDPSRGRTLVAAKRGGRDPEQGIQPFTACRLTAVKVGKFGADRQGTHARTSAWTVFHKNRVFCCGGEEGWNPPASPAPAYPQSPEKSIRARPAGLPESPRRRRPPAAPSYLGHTAPPVTGTTTPRARHLGARLERGDEGARTTSRTSIRYAGSRCRPSGRKIILRSELTAAAGAQEAEKEARGFLSETIKEWKEVVDGRTISCKNARTTTGAREGAER